MQLAGASAAVTAEEARGGIEAARSDLASGRGKGYDIGLGFIKNLGSVRGEDGITLCLAITDGSREANFHAKISGSRSASARGQDEDLGQWATERLYSIVGGISRDEDRYIGVLRRHPLHLT